jgi:membrane-bound lytic murein transglycosylase A
MILVLAPGCAWVRWPFRGVPPALVEVQPGAIPSLEDEADSGSLRLALERSLDYYDRESTRTFVAGSRAYTGAEFASALRKVLAALPDSGRAADLNAVLRTHFRVLKATGQRQPLRFTGYYTPLLQGTLAPDSEFRYPVYGKPADLMNFDLSDMAQACDCVTTLQTGRIHNGTVLPYYSRTQIERDGVLDDQNLEIAWTDDPIALFFLHIQGSGQMQLPDGQILQLNFAATNGRPFRSIGRVLLNRGVLPSGGASMQGIRAYLESHPAERDRILRENPRYTFFRVADTGAVGSLGVEVTPARSIATDPTVFPPGTLAFVQTRVPDIGPDGQLRGWAPWRRFVMNQDTGGAITGPTRIDIYFGVGEAAGDVAGRMSADGDLFFFVPRETSGVPGPDARTPPRPDRPEKPRARGARRADRAPETPDRAVARVSAP